MSRLSELAASMKHPLFADRDSLEEAMAYVEMVANASVNPIAIYTAVHLLLNTLAKELERIGWEDGREA